MIKFFVLFFCIFQKLSAECQSAGYSGTLIPYKCDLSNEEEILSMFSAIKTLHKGVDVCINNAGLAHNEPLLSGRTEGWRNMIDVGVWHTQTPKQLSFIKPLQRRHAGISARYIDRIVSRV